MENEKVAKFFIGTLLDTSVETIEVKPQEFTYVAELSGLAVFRLDFIATIKTREGELKKVLIEIQKAKNQIDLMRFRNYLAEQYKREDTIYGKKTILPITTIYILGFNLPDIETSCMKVSRHYKDLITNTILEKKSDFVEKLTHDCFIVQVERITDRYQTRLDKLLSLFEQRHFTDDTRITKEFKQPIDNEEVKISTDILHLTGTNPTEKRQIEIEQEAWRSVNAMFEDKERAFTKKLAEKEKEIEEKEKEIEEKEKALNEKQETIAEKDKIIEELLKRLHDNRT